MPLLLWQDKSGSFSKISKIRIVYVNLGAGVDQSGTNSHFDGGEEEDFGVSDIGCTALTGTI